MKFLLLVQFCLLSTLIFAQEACLTFDGSDDVIVADANLVNNLSTKDFTIEAIIQGSNNQADFPMIFSSRKAQGEGLLFFFHRESSNSDIKELSIQLENNNIRLRDNGSAGNILDEKVHHIAITRSKDKVTFYIDGKMEDQVIIDENWGTEGSEIFYIGQDGATENPFSGNISQLRIWDVVRTENEILEAENSELSGTELGLLLEYKLNEGSGQVVKETVSGKEVKLGNSESDPETYPSWDEDCDLNTISSINEIDNSIITNIYPNPASTFLNIELDRNYDEIILQVRDLTGRVILNETQQGKETYQVNISEFISGSYFIVINTPKYSSIKRFTVQ